MRVIATSLNVRSGPGTEFRVLETLAGGVIVDPKETSGDWTWVTPGNGWVSSRFLGNTRFFAPMGLNAIKAIFGEPGSPACSAGRVRLPAPLKLGWANSSVKIVSCHVKMVDAFTEVFEEIHLRGHWDLIKTFDGIYNDRPTTKGNKKSTHAWGIAIDLNAATNRYGTKGDMDPILISIFEARGFTHLKHDPMHFQYARGY